MVNIEANKTQESRDKTRLKKKVKVRREAPASDLSAPQMAEEPFWEQLRESIQETAEIFVSDMKTLFRTIKAYMVGADVDTLGMKPEQRAEYYLKKCWHQMSNNQAEEAKQTYDKLLNTYEALPEGSAKSEIYQEVNDIYQRLSKV